MSPTGRDILGSALLVRDIQNKVPSINIYVMIRAELVLFKMQVLSMLPNFEI
jgi:hypothetical protein